MSRFPAIFAFVLAAASATAQTDPVALDPTGDATAGEEQFARQCIACHLVADGDGNVLAGRTARTGPNLYALAGRSPGTVEGFAYSDALLEVGEGETIWSEETFVAFVQDPTDWLRATLDDRRARGKMAFQVRDEEDAIDIYAFLHSLAPPAAEEAEPGG